PFAPNAPRCALVAPESRRWLLALPPAGLYSRRHSPLLLRHRALPRGVSPVPRPGLPLPALRVGLALVARSLRECRRLLDRVHGRGVCLRPRVERGPLACWSATGHWLVEPLALRVLQPRGRAPTF